MTGFYPDSKPISQVKRVMGAITTARLKVKGTMYSRKLRREDKSWSLKFLNEAKAKQL